jgi:hypothetical protein
MRHFFEEGAGFDHMRMADDLKQWEIGLMIAISVGFSKIQSDAFRQA